MPTAAYGILISALLIAAERDIRNHKIPNWVVYPAAFYALAHHWIMGGLAGLGFSLSGMAAGTACLIIFWWMGGMGAGDVKLMGTVGAFLGPSGALDSFLITAVIGGIYAAGILLCHVRCGLSFKKQQGGCSAEYRISRETAPPPDQPASVNTKQPVLCYGVAIALGTLIYLINTLGINNG